VIVPLRSKTERSMDQLRNWFAEQATDVKSMVLILKRGDDTFEVVWSQQEMSDLAFAGRRLEQEIRWLMDGRTALDGSETGA
jgi:hypothetical protein